MEAAENAPVIDCSEDGWEARACSELRRVAFVKVRLTDREQRCIRDLYEAAEDAFEDRASRREMELPLLDARRLDSRSGYVDDGKREFLELHHLIAHNLLKSEDRAPAPAAHLLAVATEYATYMRKRCYTLLSELAGSASSPLGQLLASEARHASMRRKGVGDHGAETDTGFSTSMLRVYQYSRAPDLSEDHESADGRGDLSRRRKDDGDPHHDMGLLTIIPRSSFPGLDVQLPCTPHASSQQLHDADAADAPLEWVSIEKCMGEDEALIFGGLTLARLCAIPALFHRVKFQRKPRISAPYFQRPSLRVVLPVSPGHEAEEVCDYNEAIRSAQEADLISDGTVVRHRARERELPHWSHRRNEAPRSSRFSDSYRRNDSRRRNDDRRHHAQPPLVTSTGGAQHQSAPAEGSVVHVS